MAQGATALVAQINGSVPVDNQYQADFYEKLLLLQDDVLSGKHPYFKLPATTIEQFAPRPIPSSAASAPRPASNGSTTGVAANKQPVANGGTVISPDTSLPQNGTTHVFPPASPFVHKPPTTQRLFAGKPPSTGIDPIFLTKSDTLARAETQLKRQRLERALSDQVAQRKNFSREKDGALEAASRFDLSQILHAAWELVKPVSGLQPITGRQSGASDSFDENSYYSSQANEWSSSESAPNTGQSNTFRSLATPTQVTQCGGEDMAVGTLAEGHNGRPADVLHHESEKQIEPLKAQPFTSLRPDGPPAHEEGSHFYVQEPEHCQELEREESDYSPPAANAFGDPPGNEVAHDQTDPIGYRNARAEADMPAPYRQAGPPEQRPHHSLPTSPAMTAVRNHIVTPAAPQPARVSPLAFAKTHTITEQLASEHALFEQSRPESPETLRRRANEAAARTARAAKRAARRVSDTSGGPSRRQSPVAASKKKKKNAKKRHREADAYDQGRRVSGKRPALSPELVLPEPYVPEPYIKEEPYSPPPFANAAGSQRFASRQFRYRPADIEILSPQEAQRPVYITEHIPQSASRYEVENQVSPGYTSGLSRTAYGRVDRDEPDLRRVASVQHARRPLSPHLQPYSPANLQPVRAASHAYVERPVLQQPRYREESIRPLTSRYVHSRRSLSPRPISEQYVRSIHTPMIMAPPPAPRRVVVDQYGTEYYAAPAAGETRHSVAPQPYYDRALSRDPVMRAPARVVEYDEDGRFDNMPPPRPRGYIEQPDVAIVDHRAYRQREYSQQPAGSLEQVEELAPLPARELLERRPLIRYIEPAPLPEAAPRAYSVRPEGARREGPPEYVMRHLSVALQPEYVRRPGSSAQPLRGLSVAHGRDYMPVEEERYDHVSRPQQPPVRHYLDGRGLMEPPVEVEQDLYGGEGRRVAYRY